MRAAVVGGGAYVAGKHVANKKNAEADQDAAIADLQDQQDQQDQQAAAPAPAYAPAPVYAPAPAAASDDDKFEKLTKLKDLLDQGILTQSEFDLEKQKILQSM